MNTAEKKVVRIAIFLFAVGMLVRFLPWGLPAIETVDIGDRPKVAQMSKNSEPSQSRLEYGEQVPAGALAIAGDAPESGEKKPPKRAKKKKAIVHFPYSLQKVPGIGKKKLEGILPWVIFD